jgi:hypothetical protein
MTTDPGRLIFLTMQTMLRTFTILCFLVPLLASAFSARKAETPAPGEATSSSDSPKQTDTVWVSRPDGGQSCSPKSGQALDEAATELKGAGIAVFESRKGNDGKMRAQMCGLPTGGLNSYRIAKADLAKAQALGFQKL